MYQENLKRLKKQGLIGVLIGLALATYFCVDAGSFSIVTFLVVPICVAGIPYGWDLFGRVFYSLVIGSVPAMLIGFLLRICAAILIGWLVYPIVLVYTIIRARGENEQHHKLPLSRLRREGSAVCGEECAQRHAVQYPFVYVG